MVSIFEKKKQHYQTTFNAQKFSLVEVRCILLRYQKDQCENASFKLVTVLIRWDQANSLCSFFFVCCFTLWHMYINVMIRYSFLSDFLSIFHIIATIYNVISNSFNKHFKLILQSTSSYYFMILVLSILMSEQWLWLIYESTETLVWPNYLISFCLCVTNWWQWFGIFDHHQRLWLSNTRNHVFIQNVYI